MLSSEWWVLFGTQGVFSLLPAPGAESPCTPTPWVLPALWPWRAEPGGG